MSFFKKIFGSKNDKKQKTSKVDSSPLSPYEQVPWMTDSRRKTISICLNAGFKPATSLPTELNRKIRSSIEIANRLHAFKALILWLMVPEENLPSSTILDFVSKNNLKNFITNEEKIILESPRNDEELRNSIGWKFENSWPLAWYFGYSEPEITGKMMSGEQMQEILSKHTCSLDSTISEWLTSQETISEEALILKEDLFYCLHNAVRSAQLGKETVPNGFDPMVNGGVIHERRHSLTWMLSKDVDWDETDLST